MKINTANKKQLFRERMRSKMQRFASTCRLKRDKYAIDALVQLIRQNRYKNILLYIPLENEVNTMLLIKKIRRKCNIYVPFMQGVSFKMVKFRMPLFTKRFNIKEPKNSLARVRKLDLAIVPILGVDGDFGRIGFGKGMYDRFFESLKYAPKIAFVSLIDCFSKEKVCDTYDIRADIYITPYKTMIKRGKNDNRIKYSRRYGNSKRHRRVFYLQKD